MSSDVRKEQLELLKFEKKLVGLAAIVAAGSTTAANAGNKLGDASADQAYESIKQALVHLADVTTAAHASLQEKAVEIGARSLDIQGGVPKSEPPAQVVRFLFGIG